MTQITAKQALQAYFSEAATPYNDLPTLAQGHQTILDAGVNAEKAEALQKAVQTTAQQTFLRDYFTKHSGGVAGMSFQCTQSTTSPLGFSSSSTPTQEDMSAIAEAVSDMLKANPSAYGIATPATSPVQTAPAEQSDRGADFGFDAILA